MPKQQNNDKVRYEVILQEDPETKDLILPIPQPILDSLGWKEGDDIDFDIREDGTFLLTKVAK